MTSQHKIQANRRNAQLSTGPKSVTGRNRARRNALKFGLYSRTTLLPFEDASAYSALRAAVLTEYSPDGAIEESLAELIIADLWRLDRLTRIENDLIDQTEIANKRRLSNIDADSEIENILRNLQSRERQGTVTDAPQIRHEPTRFASLGLIRPSYNPTTLLDAYVSRSSETPMEDISRQRRFTNRELLRNIAALSSLQNSRKSVSIFPQA